MTSADDASCGDDKEQTQPVRGHFPDRLNTDGRCIAPISDLTGCHGERLQKSRPGARFSQCLTAAEMVYVQRRPNYHSRRAHICPPHPAA